MQRKVGVVRLLNFPSALCLPVQSAADPLWSSGRLPTLHDANISASGWISSLAWRIETLTLLTWLYSADNGYDHQQGLCESHTQF
jgi:hypothetical protein